MKQRRLIVLVLLIVGLLGGQFRAEAPAVPSAIETPSGKVTAAPLPDPVATPAPAPSPAPAPPTPAATTSATVQEPPALSVDTTITETNPTTGETNPSSAETDATSTPAETSSTTSNTSPSESSSTSPTTEPTSASSTPTDTKDYSNAFGLLQDKNKNRNYLEVKQGSDFEFKVALFNLKSEALQVKEVYVGAYKDPNNNAAKPEPFFLTAEPADRPKPWELKPNRAVGPAQSTSDPQTGQALDFGKFKLAEDATSPNAIGLTVIYLDPQGKPLAQHLRYNLMAKPLDPTKPSEEPTEPTKPTDPTKPTEPTRPGQKAKLDFTITESDKLFLRKAHRNLSFTLTNSGDVKLEIYRIELLRQGTWPFQDPSGPQTFSEQILIEPGESEKIDLLDVQVMDDIDLATFQIDVKVSYRIPTGEELDSTYPYQVKVIDLENPTTTSEPSTEPSDTGGGDWSEGGDWGGGYVGGVGLGGGTGETIPNPKARLLMEGFQTTPARVKAGEAFTLKIKLRNTSTDVFLRNLKFTLNSDGNSFLPVTGSSTIYLPKIEKDSTADVEIDFQPQANLEQKPYAITMEMVYEDQKGTELTGSETLAIPIHQDARAEIGRMEVMPQEVTVGNQVNLMFSVINKGKNKLYNVTVQAATEDQSLEVPQHFVGNIDAGSQAQVDLMATAKSPFQEAQELVVNYEDELGNVSTLKSSIDKLVINEMIEEPMEDPFDPEEIPDTEEPERGGLETWHYAAIAGGGVVLLGATTGIIRRHRRNKRNVMDLGLDDEI